MTTQFTKLAEANFSHGSVKLALYHGKMSIRPEALLAAPELFEWMVEKKDEMFYRVETDRIDAQYLELGPAIKRYLELRTSWGARDVFMHDRVKEWIERNEKGSSTSS